MMGPPCGDGGGRGIGWRKRPVAAAAAVSEAARHVGLGLGLLRCSSDEIRNRGRCCDWVTVGCCSGRSRRCRVVRHNNQISAAIVDSTSLNRMERGTFLCQPPSASSNS